eukprot:TRINITY_DN63538_c0_g1_i1.p2 TRINITY_DN63538_c0_g1~~TRINITY_DN63538_c0_g1_i1.p2  ORF type:complete len:173 (-),score=25.04 TRINITY_DN63538_c0_g1_i1:850-1368(-)
MTIKEYEIIGRRPPTPKEKGTPIFKLRIFAPNQATAKSIFNGFLKKRAKTKSSEVLRIRNVREQFAHRIKNYSITLRYQSRTGVINQSRQYRDVTTCGAVAQMYAEMASRHRAAFRDILIVSVSVIKPSQVTRPSLKQFLNPKFKFPLMRRITKAAPEQRSKYVAKRPTTFK